MTRRRVIPELRQTLLPTPLNPLGKVFRPDEVPFVTEGNEVLPPPDFSKRQFRLLGSIATSRQPYLDIPEDVVTLARYLAPRLSFGATMGCWRLPMPKGCDYKGYDSVGRARYPLITVSSLGLNKYLAHRATARILGGQVVDGKHVDHRCRDHSCCNPDHIDAVTAAENNDRGRDARGPLSLTSLEPGLRHTYAELAIQIANMSNDTAA